MSLFYTGMRGSLSADGVVIGKVRDWSLSGAAELGETTKLDDDAPTYRTLRQNYSGSCSVFYYKNAGDKVESAGLVGVILRTGKIPIDSVVRMELRSDDLALIFDAKLTQTSIAASAGDVMQASIDFNVNGPLQTVQLGGN